MLAARVKQKNGMTKDDKNGVMLAARVEQKNGMTKGRQKWRDAPLTNKAPYGASQQTWPPMTAKGHVRPIQRGFGCPLSLRLCCKSPCGGTRSRKNGNSRIRKAGSVNQISALWFASGKMFFAQRLKIVLQHNPSGTRHRDRRRYEYAR